MSSRIIKTFIHNEENGVYVINISDKVTSQTIRKIMNMLLEEEEKTQNINVIPDNIPPPTGGLSNKNVEND